MRGGPPFLVTAQVHTEFRFRELGQLVEISINKALADGAAIALEEVEAAETRFSTDPRGPGPHFKKPNVAGPTHLRASLRSTFRRAFGGSFGVGEIIVWTDNPNAVWQELGTRGRRRKTLKSGAKLNVFPFRAPPAGSSDRGVSPLYFMRTGFRRAEPKIMLLLQNALHEIGDVAAFSKTFDTVSPNFFGKK
jgi:hypothetical protein